jgi:DNA mismatch repair ATPase MutS
MSVLVQMGKFYEMFEMDAHIGVQELNLIYMKVRWTLDQDMLMLSNCGISNQI